eukprot:s275_g13.t3
MSAPRRYKTTRLGQTAKPFGLVQPADRPSGRPSAASSSASVAGEDAPAGRRWRYLVLLVLARRQLDLQVLQAHRAHDDCPVQMEPGRIGRAVSLDLTENPPPAPEVRKRALVTFNARVKGGQCCDSATQTAPAITLSKMYGGIVPRYIQRELARLRQENQLLRYRIASVAMSQPLQRSRSVRHQATQTAPALTFSTGRGHGGPAMPAVGMTRVPRSMVSQVVPPSPVPSPHAFEANLLPPMLAQDVLEASILAFVRGVELQTESQAAYRRAVIANCKRIAQSLWPRCLVELYGSYASGLGLRSSNLDLLIKLQPSRFGRDEADAAEALLSPIDEDEEQLRQLNLEEVSPGHSGRSVKAISSSAWQQQLSDRLAREKWVLSDSIRVAAHAAIPVLSFVTAPEAVKRVSTESEELLAGSTRVDICLHDSSHRGLRSKALINFLLNRYPMARPVTLVLKQWLIEQAYSMSHSGGLCSYGLLLMVVALLQHFPATSLAAALVGFLNFYGRRFDPQLYGVSVARAAFLKRKSPTTWPPEQAELVERGLLHPTSAPAGKEICGEEAHRFDPLWASALHPRIQSEYVDYYLEIQATFGGGERYYTVEPKILDKSPSPPLPHVKVQRIDDGRIVAQTANGYEVKTLHDMGLASDLHSGMQLVNRLRRHGFNLVGNKPEDLVPINNTHPSSSRSWETFFVFSMKVPLSFLREHPEVEDPVNPTNNVGRNCFRIRQIQRSLARAADVVAANEAGATLRAILRVETYGAGDGQEAEAEALSMRAKHDLQELRAMPQRTLLGLGLLAYLSATAPLVPLPPAEPNPPSWPSSVYIFGPEDAVNGSDLTARIAALLSELNNVTTGHYSSDRKALLFKPGTYETDIEVGYYVQVLGLGERPEDVQFTSAWGVHSKPMGAIPDPGSLDNFWRSAENFHHASPWGMLWAVSQASPIRRIRVDKNLTLSVPGAWASGGYMADMQVGGSTVLGGQQQWIVRNSNISTTDAAVLGGQWNVVLVGCTGSPRETLPAEGSKTALTNVALTPVIAEKPYITIEATGRYNLQVPKPKFRSVGPAVEETTTTVPFEQVYVARAEDLTSTIQSKLTSGLHVVLSPGIYNLTATLTLTFKNQVLLGIGMATLVAPKDGSPCVLVENAATGARVAGIVLQANFAFDKATASPPPSSLLEWGRSGVAGDADPANPGVLSDIFARVGGPDTDRKIGADVAVHIQSDNATCAAKPSLNPDGTVNWVKWHELVKDSKLPYMTFDPPQKKVSFSKSCRNCYFFPPRSWIGKAPPCCFADCLQYQYGPYSHLQISDADAPCRVTVWRHCAAFIHIGILHSFVRK